jgi:pimeloyl-ACP methyl ester carboxylesterase
MKEYLIKKSNSKIRYYDLGDDERPILFIHGLGCLSSFDYPKIAEMESLSKHRRIIVDLLGSGHSEKPNEFSYTINDHASYLKEFLEDLDLKDVILYGHSMGGSIAISLAAQCPERISNLIISEANLDSGGGNYSKKIASYNEKDYVKRGHFEVIKENRENSNNIWADGLEKSYALAVNREAKSIVEGENPSWREKLYSLKIKRIFIFGENSLPHPDFDELKKHGIHIVIVKNAGHSMAWENPEGLSKAISNGINL